MSPKGTTKWGGAWKWILPALFLLTLVGLWQLAASTGMLADLFGLEDFLVPSPAEIGEAAWENRSLLAENAWVTLQEILLGFGCALLAGVGFAVAMHFSGFVLRATYPLVIASQTIPIVAIAPILVIWFGFGIAPKLIVIALICFFPIVVNTLDGLASVDRAQVRMLRTLDASRTDIFRHLELPSALPYLFSGAKIAVAVAVIGAVFGELVGSDAGLGHAIQVGTAQLLTARVFAAVLILSLMAIALFGLVAALERWAVPWARPNNTIGGR
jgi:putative hydroxymethylpyrimidine transport system permease protein